METVVLLGFGDYGCFFISSSVIFVLCSMFFALNHKTGQEAAGVEGCPSLLDAEC